jgi:hypothetical protein
MVSASDLPASRTRKTPAPPPAEPSSGLRRRLRRRWLRRGIPVIDPVPMMITYNGKNIDLLSRTELVEIIRVLMQDREQLQRRELSAIKMVRIVAEALK